MRRQDREAGKDVLSAFDLMLPPSIQKVKNEYGKERADQKAPAELEEQQRQEGQAEGRYHQPEVVTRPGAQGLV